MPDLYEIYAQAFDVVGRRSTTPDLQLVAELHVQNKLLEQISLSLKELVRLKELVG